MKTTGQDIKALEMALVSVDGGVCLWTSPESIEHAIEDLASIPKLEQRIAELENECLTSLSQLAMAKMATEARMVLVRSVRTCT